MIYKLLRLDLEAFVTYYSHLSLAMSMGNKEHKLLYHNKSVTQPKVLDSFKVYTLFNLLYSKQNDRPTEDHKQLQNCSHMHINSTHHHLKLSECRCTYGHLPQSSSVPWHISWNHFQALGKLSAWQTTNGDSVVHGRSCKSANIYFTPNKKKHTHRKPKHCSFMFINILKQCIKISETECTQKYKSLMFPHYQFLFY